ncbi:transposase [Streptomyces chilikensis]|uniref:transposase n=1 Tax=Streptomyces chilikensis TaxID=1194079 RepID=UPI0023F8ED72|nr:transposase [Streptomyces chilikensis]
MTDLVERLVPDELWVLSRRVVPPTVTTRPQGGGRRRAGDREALAAIILVVTSGCTWRQLPPAAPPLRTQSRTLPHLRRHSRSPHRLPPPGELAHGLSRFCCTSKQISPMDSATAAA